MEKTELIYGTRAVMEAILAGKEIEKILIQSGTNNELVRELINTARDHKTPIAFVPAERLKRISTKNHQGVICILASVSYASLDSLIERAYSDARDPFLVVLDRITDVRNFGAIVRTAECAGVDGIVVPEKGNVPITSDAMKTSAGALNYIPVCRESSLRNTLKSLRETGIRVIACTEKAEKNLYDVNMTGPIAILLGSEEDGVGDDLLREADELARIPLKGKINSLNVSVAASLAMYEVVRQRTVKV